MKNIFLFFILSSLFLSLINTQSIFILESAEEKTSSDKNILTFTIQAGINDDINSNINFQIESEFYENDKYIKDKRIDCTIPKASDVSFGTKINIKCSIDLYYIDCLKSNKVKFIKFIKNDNLEINDSKQNVLGNNFLFEKRLKETEKDKEKDKDKDKDKEKKEVDIKADYEFTADKITYIQYNGNQLTFLIKSQYDSIFTPSFDFDLIINRNIKTKCKSPGLFLTKEGSINCTLIIVPLNNNNILESIKDGIIIKENIYRLQRSFNDDKVFKFSIRNGDKLEIKDFNLNKGQIFKEKEEDEDKKSEWEIQREIDKRRRKREEEKKKKDQEELDNLRRRQQVEKKQNKNNNYNPFYTPSEYDKNQNKNNNYPNNNYNNNNNNFFNNQNDDNEQIDYNSNVKLIHLQVRYS